MIINKDSKRVGIYYFNDKDGIFDNSADCYIQKISFFLSKIIFVHSGNLTKESFEQVSKYTDTILSLEKGYKFDAYKLGFSSIENIESYDEVLFFDNTLIGPFYDLAPMFDDMNNKDLDFWGLHYHYHHISSIRERNQYKTKYYSVVPDHMPWSFFAIRKNLFTSKFFKKFISSIKYEKTSGKSSFKNEIKSYELFSNAGFKSQSYLQTDDLKLHSYNPLIVSPYTCINEKKSPFLYTELFYMDMARTLEFTLGQDTVKTFNFIDSNTDFDINMVWDNILRVGNQHDIKNSLSLTYILPSDYDMPVKTDYNASVALCMHLYYEDLFDYCLEYAKSMPAYTDVFLTTNNQDKKEKIEQVFSVLDCGKLDVRVIGNRGRDVSSLLIGLKDVVRDYDIICYAHDKKTSQFSPHCVGETFSYQCFENILKSSNYANNVIETFKRNPRLGTLSPSPPFHAEMYTTIGREWIFNYQNTVDVANKHGITVNIDESKPPVAPLGTMFWLRGDALVSLCDDNMTYEDFPPEPNDTNGTILHAYERIYSYAAQNSGYYAAQVFADTYAQLQMNAQYHMLRDISHFLFNKASTCYNNYNLLLNEIKKRFIHLPEKSIYRLLKEYLLINLNKDTVKKIKEIKHKLKLGFLNK